MTALAGMTVPASSDAVSMPVESGGAELPLMNIPVCADPLETARLIRAQVEEAAQAILHEQQVESVHSALNHTQFLLTGESEYLQVDEPETEFVEETESELIEETEEAQEVWPVEVDEALLADDEDASSEQAAPQTEAPSDGEEASAQGEGSSLPGPGHGMFTVPEMQSINIARLNLYDYRLLRSCPLPVLPKDMHRLYDQTKQLTDGFDGEWSVYVQNLSTGQTMVMNDRPLNSASVMKLFIMETLYEAFAEGTVPRNEDTVYLLRNMIINSSNESSNRLLEILGNGDLAAGVSKVNDFILSHGYTPETVIYNGFQDPAATLDENSIRYDMAIIFKTSLKTELSIPPVFATSSKKTINSFIYETDKSKIRIPLATPTITASSALTLLRYTIRITDIIPTAAILYISISINRKYPL